MKDINKLVNYLIIEPTTRCNFHCKFCCGRSLKQGDMSLEKFVSIVDIFKDLKYIHLQGEGEPFLNPSFFDMVKYANDKCIKISTISNGSLLTPEIVNKIINTKIESIYISIEWPDKDNFSEFRGGNLDNIKDGIRCLMRERKEKSVERPTVGFAITVLKDTVELFPDIINLYNELGMDGGISVNFLNVMDEYTKNYDDYTKLQGLTHQEKREFIFNNNDSINKINSQRSIRTFLEELYDCDLKDSYKNIEYNECPWLEKALFINYEGFVTCCCAIKDFEKYSLGVLGSTSVEDIFSIRQAIHNEILKGIIPNQCYSCNVTENIVKLKHSASKNILEEN